MEKTINNLKFVNLGGDTCDLYVYGQIVNEKDVNFWTGEVSQTDVDISDFKAALEQIHSGQTLNIYVNSPGGSVFVASAMVSMLKRKKEDGVNINAYIDGVAASAASFLIMAADKVHIYQNSMMMIHKPIAMSFGNADDLQKDIDTLNQIEKGVMIPLYMSKAKCDETELVSMIAEETWLTADQLAEKFDVELLEEVKPMAAMKSDMYSMYKNAPKGLIPEDISTKLDKLLEKLGGAPIDYSEYEKVLNNL